ncbi:uncharacterized protein N7483_002316 [Penicillium malachiteum]|uniref:uncharacterized protein n=1 Tax=Penicillium malachiteum TaxID=1324776 RepID=UPI0025497D98|nr:uncharacterized protein N7483_002316 [Penicillium malachiteum]KAJ5737191.1 hypothetical protein N7483_002316 [Penicillium malachiteum]
MAHDFSRNLSLKNEFELDSLLQQGTFKPVFLYQVILFNCLPWVALVIPKHHGGQYLRPLVFGLGVAFALELLRNHRALLGGNGYLIGLIAAWWLVWAATLFLFSDVERDFQRIERNDPVRNLKLAEIDELSKQIGETDNRISMSDKVNSNQHAQFRWQSYPSTFLHRVEWCAGLLFNLRGPEWNWRASRFGPLPQTVYAQLKSGFLSNNYSVEEDESYISTKDCLRNAFRTFLISYMTLDILKVVMMRDPYFRGITADAIPPFPFIFLASIPLGIRFYRCFISCMGVYVALNYVTSLNPIFFLGLSLAYPNASRRLTGAPLDEPWLYAESFGPFIAPTLEQGLAGTWGRWWHQLFRYGFTSPGRWVISLYPISWRKSAAVKRATYLIVAFALSGIVHACGSYTQFTNTKPLSGPFLFFISQSVAIIVEGVLQDRDPPNASFTSYAAMVKTHS